MTARCGSMDPRHIARRCAACKKVYRQRYRDGLPLLARHYADPACCAFCGLAAGNSLGVSVYRYPLGRHVYRESGQTTVTIGNIGLCDTCILRRGLSNGRGVRRAVAA